MFSLLSLSLSSFRDTVLLAGHSHRCPRRTVRLFAWHMHNLVYCYKRLGVCFPPLHYFYSRRCSYILTKSKRCALQFFACVFLSNTSRSALTFFAYRRFLIIYVFLYTLFILILFAAPLSGSELVVWFADGRSSLGTPDLATPDGLAPTVVLVQGSMLRPRRGPSIDRAFTTGRNVFAR